MTLETAGINTLNASVKFNLVSVIHIKQHPHCYRKFKKKGMTNGALSDVVQRTQHGVLYFQNVAQFHGTFVNVMPYTLT